MRGQVATGIVPTKQLSCLCLFDPSFNSVRGLAGGRLWKGDSSPSSLKKCPSAAPKGLQGPIPSRLCFPPLCLAHSLYKAPIPPASLSGDLCAAPLGGLDALLRKWAISQGTLLVVTSLPFPSLVWASWGSSLWVVAGPFSHCPTPASK